MNGMTDARTSPEPFGLLLPVESLALLGASSEGALAIREFGWGTRNFDEEFQLLVESLESRGEEARDELEATRSIVAVAREARGWLAVLPTQPGGSPTLVLLSAELALAARILGELVELVAGRHDMVGRIVASLQAVESGELRLVALRGGFARSAAQLRGETADLGASDGHELARLTAAATVGVESLVKALIMSAIDAQVQS